jgi:hypothetical protein
MSIKNIEKYFEKIKNITPEKKEEWISKIEKLNNKNDKAVLLFEDLEGKKSWTMATKVGDNNINLLSYGIDCPISEIDNVFKGHKCVGVAGSTEFCTMLQNASVGIVIKTSTNFISDKYKEQRADNKKQKQSKRSKSK